ncbi:unnamed protein product [Trifolium pratense]|uniref:Uncharacterized protein n=1 Tax=Trifolium pratense TaxID=57577 RepID=A0ACB0KYL8_TRIPR|nr:unnamed protein product [Trifolium pratense]
MMDVEASNKSKFCGDGDNKPVDLKCTASYAQNTLGFVFCYDDDEEEEEEDYVPLIRKSVRILSLETFNRKCDASVKKRDATTHPVKRLFEDNNSHIVVKKSKVSSNDDYNEDEEDNPSSNIFKRAGKSIDKPLSSLKKELEPVIT